MVRWVRSSGCLSDYRSSKILYFIKDEMSVFIYMWVFEVSVFVISARVINRGV